MTHSLNQDEEHQYKSDVRIRLSHAARSLGFRWYDMYYVERDLRYPLPEYPAPPGVEFRLANEEDQQEILKRRPRTQAKRLQLRFSTPGIRCYIASLGGQLAGYSMLRHGLMDMTGLDAIELRIRELPERTGLTHDAYVWPEFRCHGLFHALLAHIHRERQQAGDDRVINLIDPDNVWSLKVHLDMGAKIQRVRFGKLPGGRLRVVGRNFEIGSLDRR